MAKMARQCLNSDCYLQHWKGIMFPPVNVSGFEKLDVEGQKFGLTSIK